MLLIMKRRITILIIMILAAGAMIWFLVLRPKESSADLDGLAQCLAEKGITMYGAYWCPHCQNEKRAFGDSFRFVPYVECTAEPQRCVAAGIRGYPTWIFPDGRRLEGEQGIEKLSRQSGCPLK
jgi:glutaredoxin